MAAIASHVYFRFLVSPHLTLGRCKTIGIPNFDLISQITVEILLLPFSERRLHIEIHCHRHVILHWPTKFYANRMIADGIITSFWFYKMAAMASQIYFRFLIWSCLTFRKVEIGIPTFDQVSQYTAEILLLPVSENKRPPYLNSTSGFDFDLFTAISMLFSIGTPNFIEIGSSTAELWRHCDFQDVGRQFDVSQNAECLEIDTT